MTRFMTNKLPLIVGEFGFSSLNIFLAKKLNYNIYNLVDDLSVDDSYEEFSKIIKKDINIFEYDRIVFIHTLVIIKKLRGIGITEEFIEGIYRDFYSEKTAILAYVKPFQKNKIDSDYFLNKKDVDVREHIKEPSKYISAKKYYELTDFMDKEDNEMNEYKLFNLAKKCGFNRINDSYLFILNPNAILKRIKNKTKIIETTQKKENNDTEFYI